MPRSKQHAARAAVVAFPGTSTGLARVLPSGRSLLIAGAIVGAVVGAYAVARTSSLFALDAVEVRGAPPALEQRIQRALLPLSGESLLVFRSDQADERLATIPEVASATYDRSFPHTLTVTVRAEQPVAILRQGSGAWLAATHGRVLTALAPRARPGLPRVWIPRSTSVALGGQLPDPAAVRALRTLGAAARVGFSPRVAFVRSTSNELTLALRSGIEIRLGDLDRLGLKFAIAARLLPAVEAPAEGPAYLDLTVPERPVASAANPQVTGIG